MTSVTSNGIFEIVTDIKESQPTTSTTVADGTFITEVGNSSEDGELKVGDKILEINEETVEGLTHEEIVSKLNTAPQEVKLKLLRTAAKHSDEVLGGAHCSETPVKPEDSNQTSPPNQECGETGNDSKDETGEDSTSDEMGDNESPEDIFRKVAAKNRIEHRTIDDNNLPSTVKLIPGAEGKKIYLIGTAHFSKESCEDVRSIIRQAQPDVVVIELCRGRTDLLTNDEETLTQLAGEISTSKVLSQIRQKGFVSGIMTFLLLHMSAHITKQLGMAPGAEFRTAYREARCVPGCKVMFGDRPVEITLNRAFATLSWLQKIRFAGHILKDLGPIKPEDIEELKKKDMLEQALGEMMKAFPKMTEVFLEERDTYLARSLQLAANNEIVTTSGVSPTVVVGVVGIGHAAGTERKFNENITLEQMKELMRVPQPSVANRVFKICIRAALAFTVVFGVWHVFRWAKPVIYSLLSNAASAVNIGVRYFSKLAGDLYSNTNYQTEL